jgi:hypothetical protein
MSYKDTARNEPMYNYPLYEACEAGITYEQTTA